MDINIAHLRYIECNSETPAELCMRYATEYEERKKFLRIVNSGKIVSEEKCLNAVQEVHKTMIDLRELYQSNERFRGYVDRCATTYRVAAEEILSHALTREVAQSYLAEDEEPEHTVASVYTPIGECV